MRKKTREKRGTVIFYVLTFLIGILICVLAFVFTFNFFSVNNKSFESVVSSQFATPSFNKFTALINKIENNSCEIYNMNMESNSIIKITDAVKIYDKNNSKVDLSKLCVGAIVDVTSDNGQIKSLAINKNVWKKSHIANFNINHDSKILSYNDKSYSFCDNTLVVSKNNLYDIKKIKPLCIITITGLDNNIWFVEVNKGYGNINFLNTDKITSGILKIDSKSPLLLRDTKTLELSEGHHIISISGDNIEIYNRDLFINSDDRIDINLSDVQFKCGILKLKINKTDCMVYIDNKKVSMSEPILLNYGEYNLKVVKDGFKDYSEKIFIDRDVNEINVRMYGEINLNKSIEITSDNFQIDEDNNIQD